MSAAPSIGQVLNSTPGALGAPDTRAQCLELHDLAVVDEQIDLVSVVLDIPFEYRRVGAFEHDLFEPELIDDAGDHISAPGAHVFGDPFAFDHDDVGSGI